MRTPTAGTLAARATTGALVAVIVVGSVLGVGCPPVGPLSEEGRYQLERHGLASRLGFQADGWVGEPVLVGERTCPTLLCRQDGCGGQIPADGGVAACVQQTVTGATLAEGCVTFDAPGEVAWDVVPVACAPPPDAGVTFEADRFAFRAIATEDVVAEQQPRVEQYARDWLDQGALVSEPAVPAGFGEPRSSLRIVEGGRAPVTAALLGAEDGQLVAVAGGSLVLEEVEPTAESVRVTDGWLLEADPGASAVLRLARQSASFDLASIAGVQLADATAMSLVAFYWSGEEEPGFRAPAAVHALVLDAQGRAIDGAPIEWTLAQGDVATDSLYAQLGGRAADEQRPFRRGPWLTVGDLCRPPSQRAGFATALLRARLGALVQDVRLEWTLPVDTEGSGTWLGFPSTAPADDEGFTRDPACPDFPACGCASVRSQTGTNLPTNALIALLALAVLARANRRPRKEAAAPPPAPTRRSVTGW